MGLISLLLMLFASAASCGGEDGKLDEIVDIEVGEEVFRIEVARTDEQRRKGLMHRSSIGENEGMLFVFERDQHMSFWMKNTEIPLSIAYISKDGTIREIHDLEPHSQRTVESRFAVRYALELPRGAFSRAGAEPGDVIEFPGSIP